MKTDLKSVPPGFQNGMNFGTGDVNLEKLTISSKLSKTEQKDSEDTQVMEESDLASIIDLADLLKEKGSIFKWMEEEPSQPRADLKSKTLIDLL